MRDFCLQIVRQTSDDSNTANQLLTHHQAHREIGAYFAVSDGKDSQHLVDRFIRFSGLVNETVDSHNFENADAQLLKQTLIKFAYQTVLSTFTYQVGDNERRAMREGAMAFRVEIP